MEKLLDSSKNHFTQSWQKWLILFGTGIAGVTIGLDLTIVNASLPSIQQELTANLNQLRWIMAGFGLFFCAFLVTAGRLGDIYGRKKLLIISLTAFGIASLGAGLAYSANFLILMRMTQGFFGAAILPCGTALTAHAFPQKEQGRALGIYGSLVGIGIGVGPLVGGTLTTILNWRWIFFINLPIVLISLIICTPTLKESKHQKKIRADWLGAIILALMLGLLTFSISEYNFYGLRSTPILGSIIGTIISFILFFLHEKRVAHPILPPQLLKNPSFVLATIIYAGAIAFHWPVLFLMPLYLQKVVGYGSGYSNLVLSAMTLMTIFSPAIAGYFYDRKSKSLAVHSIFALNILSVALFLTFNQHGPLPIILISFVLFGLAWGIGNGIATPIALHHLDNTDDAGVISGALTTVLNIFAILSLTIITSIFQSSKQYFFTKEAKYAGKEAFKNTEQIIAIHKTAFLHGTTVAYSLIILATLLCWVWARKIMIRLLQD